MDNGGRNLLKIQELRVFVCIYWTKMWFLQEANPHYKIFLLIFESWQALWCFPTHRSPVWLGGRNNGCNTSAVSSIDWQFACRGVSSEGYNGFLESGGDVKSKSQLGCFWWCHSGLLHTKSEFFSPEIAAYLKINTTSRCVNHNFSLSAVGSKDRGFCMF